MIVSSAGDGKHILAEFWQCECDLNLLCQKEQLLTHLCRAVKNSGLTLVGQTAHAFLSADENGTEKSSGVTISLLLAESHFCVHTWGEIKAVTLDIYVCNFTQNNSDKADYLFNFCYEFFQPTTYNEKMVRRYHQRICRR